MERKTGSENAKLFPKDTSDQWPKATAVIRPDNTSLKGTGVSEGRSKRNV